MKDTYTYQIGENLYINLTNRCTNRCVFCVRNGKETYEGHALWLKGREPAAEEIVGEIVGEIGDPKRYREIVFCGFGEPTFRLDAMLMICDAVHAKGGRTRLNTNGHGSLIADMDITQSLVGRLDGINISLNAPDEESYNAVCRPQKEGAFRAMLDFAAACKRRGICAWFSVVDCIGEEAVGRCKKLAEEVGLPLRVRETIV